MTITTHRKPTDSHRISNAAWTALLAAPMRTQMYGGNNRRQEQRVDKQQIVYFGLDLSDTNMPRDRFLVRTRDISENGLGFTHGQDVKTGTRCKVAMITVDQRLISVVGVVASCVDRGDGNFNVGITFEKAIRVNDFVVG
jgi:hypothetical protein